MVDHVTKFQSIRVNLVSSRRFFLIADYVIYLRRFFLSRDVVLAFSGISSYSYVRRRDFYAFSRVAESRGQSNRVEKNRVVLW